ACDSAQALILRQRDELRTAADEPARRLAAVTAGVRDSVSAMLSEAEATRQATVHAGEEASDVLVQLASLRAELKPWAPFVIDRAPGAPIPEPLQGVIQDVRFELARDLGCIADAMRQISDKASAVATKIAGV
ncbi:MAG: hypothetical protein K2X32_14045, partial [Phycisphaerales bacterium]|nr:hypothetical protein [Phycisphaerales bacterium]